MSVSPPPSTQNPNVVITVGAGNTISYAIDGAQPVPSCKLTDLTSNGGLYASFSLDAPSTKAGWSMTGVQVPPSSSPLVITNGRLGQQKQNQNNLWTVWDPAVPATGGPYHFSFQYTNGTTSFWSDPEVGNEQ